MHTLPASNGLVHSACLSERLLAIAERVPKDCVVCDVGSDHGALPLYLLKSGHCPRVVVTDLNCFPLERAKKALVREQVDHLADFLLTDGIDNTTCYNPDVYVIAGMGGETISGILERGISSISAGITFILQPMSREAYLRKFLYENGFRVYEETVVFENDKFFPVFCATYDKIIRKQDDFFYKFGEYLPKNTNSVIKRYWKALLNKVRTKKEGRINAKLDVLQEEKEEQFLLSLMEDNCENL